MTANGAKEETLTAINNTMDFNGFTQAAINSGQRMARTLPNGDREMLDDAGRAEELKRTQDGIASNCGAAPAAQ